MSNDINNTEVETTQPQTQETTVSKTRKDAREVIRTHIIDAVTDLGGKAQGEPIKAWILNKVEAKVEDFGRTPTNKKYPNGRHVFVECYTHIQRDFKKKGLLFTPAWGWVSLTEGETVEVEGKALSKPKKTAESTRKAQSEATEEVQTPTEALSVEPQEEAVQSEAVEVEVARVEPQEEAPVVVGFSTQEEEDDYMASNQASLDTLNAQLKAEHPNHCTKCGGVGGVVGTSGDGWNEPVSMDWDDCEACLDQGINPLDTSKTITEEDAEAHSEMVIEDTHPLLSKINEFERGLAQAQEDLDMHNRADSPTVLERVLELTENHEATVDNHAVIEAWVDVAKKELVEDIGKTKPYRKALSEVEVGYILSIGAVREEEIIVQEEVIVQEEESEAFEVQPFGAEVKAEVDSHPEETNTPIEKETNADEYVLEQEDQTTESEEYVLPVQETEVEAGVEPDGVQEYSLDDLFDDDFFDEDEGQGEKKKRHSLDLKAIDGEVWGEIKDGFVYLADSPDPTTVLRFKEDLKDETEGKTEEKKEKHSLALQQISSKGLPTYWKILKNASKKMRHHYEEGDVRFATHNQEGFHGCFGNIETNKTLCSLSCPISQLCTNASVVEL
jgi:hypothetical protein